MSYLQNFISVVKRHEHECSCLKLQGYSELFTVVTLPFLVTTKLQHRSNGKILTVSSNVNSTEIRKGGYVIDLIRAAGTHPIPQT